MSASKLKFPVLRTNANRANAGSERGIACRRYSVEVAQRLNSDKKFVVQICKLIRRKPCDFNYAVAGVNIPTNVVSAEGGSKTTRTKTNLRIVWNDGRWSNFRVKNSKPSQIHLQLTENFFAEYEAQYGKEIPQIVKEAFLLFTGRHARQKEIHDSIPVGFVGDTVRDVERKYNNRLTLASMYGYDDEMPVAFLKWFRDNASDLFAFCFAMGAARERNWMCDYLWYHDGDDVNSNVVIYDIRTLIKKIEGLTEDELAEMIHPNDSEQIGSTIALPFGTLQYHLCSVQFRHSPEKIATLFRHSATKNKFGAKPKLNGHENEKRIAEELNTNKSFRAHFCDRVGRREEEFKVAEAGGLSAAKEESVLGDKTTGKTDISVFWKDGKRTNISIKMASAGQVYLVTAKNFVAVYEAQYNVLVPSRVRRALAFFIGEDPESRTILEATDISVDGEDARKIAIESNFRLMFKVIQNYDPKMAQDLLSFLKEKIDNVFELSFTAGAVKDRSLWSDVLWYKNLVNPDGMGLDYMVPIALVKAALQRKGNENVVEPGPKNAGSTIHLPFGHLQYHLKQLEFYQKLQKIQELVTN